LLQLGNVGERGATDIQVDADEGVGTTFRVDALNAGAMVELEIPARAESRFSFSIIYSDVSGKRTAEIRTVRRVGSELRLVPVPRPSRLSEFMRLG
jgi:hypothetical protein